MEPPTAPPPQPEPKTGLTPLVGLIVGTVIGGLILLVAVGIFVICYRRRNRRRPDEGPATSDPTPTPSTGHPLALSQIIFSYELLAIATNGFSEKNFIGEGGFGHVHKGSFQMRNLGQKLRSLVVSITNTLFHWLDIAFLGNKDCLFMSLSQMVTWNIICMARPLLAQALKHGNFEAVVDPRLQNDYVPTELARMVACAAACVRYMARSRPRISQALVNAADLAPSQLCTNLSQAV
ncbi:hypothetical protein CMV_017789 [Castanea mollissima]|uniref:non-specific serine/threonine protein kinase n=1 Tax=Castanea mollissima TaxID=60419 RepID=A0A8J4QX09_9ROSI|nr:hypothetical protein CMV_017789 [Castanea mollissima]